MLVNEFLDKSVRQYPEKEALVFEEKRLTYNQIHLASNSFANALISNGFQRQDVGLIYLDNCDELVISLFGILKASGIFVVINPLITPKRLHYMLNDCRAKTLVTNKKNLEKIKDILQDTPNIKNIILLEDQQVIASIDLDIPVYDIISYQDIMDKYSNLEPVIHNIDVDLAAIVYTSGSTNFSKGVMLTHANMVAAADSITSYFNNTADDIIFTCLPLAFDYSLYQMLTAFYVGGKVVIQQNFLFPTKILNALAKERVTGFAIVPTIAALMKELRVKSRNDLSCVRYICSSAQALPKSSITYLLNELFSNACMFSMYGLTECKSVSCLDPNEIDVRPDSVGKALPNMEVYVIDNEGNKKYCDATGELVVRGSNVMRGYLNNEIETNKKLKPGSIAGEMVLHTGDLFFIDKDGFLYFRGRIDNMINSSGIQISPKEIEDVLYEIDGVLEVAVFGISHHIYGEAIKAVISVEQNKNITEEMIRKYCLDHLEKVSVPHFFEIRTTILPKTPTGKIDKKALIN